MTLALALLTLATLTTLYAACVAAGRADDRRLDSMLTVCRVRQ